MAFPIRSVHGRRWPVARGISVAACCLAPLMVAPKASADDTLTVDLERRDVRVGAVSHPGRFQGSMTRSVDMPGYHFLVRGGGRAAESALFTTPVDDRSVLAALERIGAVPGNTLRMDTWEARHDRDNAAPDRRIEGSPVDVELLWAGIPRPVPLTGLLEDPGGKGFDFRFGGHGDNIPIWESGCVVCLYSCPGSKVGNAAYTVRDYVWKTTRFRIRKDRFPPEGTPVTVIFRLR